jgi:hypothetical protein
MSFSWIEDDKLEKMKGRIVKEIRVENNDEELIFVLDNNETVTWNAVGDCCSSSWIEHFDEIKESAKILDFISLEISPSFDPKESINHFEEEMKYYFYELLTEKGNYKIEMRNSSNGYYGGWLQ